jgi:hypothetical protein
VISAKVIEFIKSPLDSLHKNWAREWNNLHKAKTADLSDTKCTSGHGLPPCGLHIIHIRLPVPTCMHNQEYWFSQWQRTGPQPDYFQFPRVKFIQACRQIYLKQQPQQCVSHAWGWSHKLNAATSAPVTIQFSLWLHIIDRTAWSCACLSKALLWITHISKLFTGSVTAHKNTPVVPQLVMC